MGVSCITFLSQEKKAFYVNNPVQLIKQSQYALKTEI